MTLHHDPHEDQALLSRYLDGDLRADQSTALEQHIKQCATCRQEIKQLRQTIDWIGQLRNIQAPNDFPVKVHQRIRRQRGKRRRALANAPHVGGFSWITAILVFIVIALSIAVFFLGQMV